MADLRVAPSIPNPSVGGTIVPQKRTVSIAEIEKRTARAAQIEKIFSGIKPGQRLSNANEYINILQTILEQASQDYAVLHKPGIKETESVQKARTALDKQIAVLQKIRTIAQTAKILPSTVKPAAEGAGFPWHGKLRKGETPLHWAVRNHDHRTALSVRYQMRQSRLAAVCERFAANVKDTKVAAILKKPDFLPTLVSVVEMLHVTSFIPKDSKSLLEFFQDPEIVKVVQDPNFSKIFKDPHALQVLNGLDILSDLDSKNISPIEEAILQKDPEMTHILLFSHLLNNPQLKQIFWARIQELKSRMEAMRNVEPSILSEASRAAYLGDKSQLEFMTENELNAPDAKGLTPLHYALLGGHGASIEYLLPRCNLYTLTPQGHSYLDYAILSGHSGAMAVFQKFKVPLKLCKEEELFSYYLASGILNQQLTLSAKQKDPLAFGTMDTIFAGINATWLGCHLMNQWMGTPQDGGPGWLGWSSRKIEGYADYVNDILGLNRIFNSVPSQIAPAVHISYLLNVLALPTLGWMGNMAFGTPYWPGVIKLVNDHITPVNPTYVATGYALLRIAAAVKPVLEKMPVYYDNFRSRPKEVLKNLALDTFIVGSQCLISTQF